MPLTTSKRFDNEEIQSTGLEGSLSINLGRADSMNKGK